MKIFMHNRAIKRHVKKTSAEDLKIRFLELQELRQKVKLAECGRIAGALDGPCFRGSQTSADTPQEEPKAGRH